MTEDKTTIDDVIYTVLKHDKSFRGLVICGVGKNVEEDTVVMWAAEDEVMGDIGVLIGLLDGAKKELQEHVAQSAIQIVSK